MSQKNDPLSALFPATLRRGLLVHTYLHPDEDFHGGALARLLKVSRGALARELADLTATGVLKQGRRGNQVLYRANRDAPFFAELQGLIQKTAGVVPLLAQAVQGYADALDYAFIFGSLARGDGGPGSDIDLMLIGDGISSRMKAELNLAMRQVGQKLDIQDMTLLEYRALLRQNSPFVQEVLRGPIIMLLGARDGLEDTGDI